MSIPVITEFLDKWQEKSLEWYRSEYAEFSKCREEHDKKSYELFGDRGSAEKMEFFRQYKSRMQNRFDAFTLSLDGYGSKGADEKIVNAVVRERQNKEISFINRITKVVGDITDASHLYIAVDGEINGYVTGTTGKASVTTIGAGGYNVQRYHYRVLVKKVG